MSKVDQIRDLLKSIETGDPGPVAVVNQSKYIQHNPQTHEGSDGLEVLFARLSKTNPRVNMARGFEDGDYVFAQMEYDFSARKIGFEVFRFENGQAVEHWDNIQPRVEPTASGRTMIDGPVDPGDLTRTEANRALVSRFVNDVLIAGQWTDFDGYFEGGQLTQYAPTLPDGAAAFRAAFDTRSYTHCHRVLAQGSFVLTVCEGTQDGVHSSFYGLFHVENGKITAYWETIEKVPPREVWRNDNGKF